MRHSAGHRHIAGRLPRRRSGRLHPRRRTGLPHRPQPHLPSLPALHPNPGRRHLRHAPLPRPDTQLSRLNLITKRGYATTHPNAINYFLKRLSVTDSREILESGTQVILAGAICCEASWALMVPVHSAVILYGISS